MLQFKITHANRHFYSSTVFSTVHLSLRLCCVCRANIEFMMFSSFVSVLFISVCFRELHWMSSLSHPEWEASFHQVVAHGEC